MNKLTIERRVAVVQALVEGNSIRATCRLTGVAKGTVLRLVEDVGLACEAFHHKHVHSLEVKRLQVDEIWSFCYAKEKNVPTQYKGMAGFGDAWTFTCIEGDTKLAVGWMVGTRDASTATAFLEQVAARLASRVQVTTDAHRMYLSAVPGAFGMEVDYAMLHKVYRTDYDHDTRYSPPICSGVKSQVITGDPDPDHISTSYVERANLTMRMSMRRMTRLTNGFSKKLVNLRWAVALHFTYYNFCRIHSTIGTTPAVAAGVAKEPLSIDLLLRLLDSQSHGN